MLEVSLRPFSEETLQTVSCSCLNEKVATSRRRSPVIGSTRCPCGPASSGVHLCSAARHPRAPRATWQLTATRASAQSSRKKATTSLDQSCHFQSVTLMRVLVHLLIRCTLTFLNKIHHRPSKVGPWTTEPWKSSQLWRKGAARRGGFFSDQMQNQSKHKPFMSQQ